VCYPHLVDQVNEFLNGHKWPVLLCVLGLVLIVGGISTSNLLPKKPKPLKSSDFPKMSIVQTSSTIKVDVSGAVENPGVYEVDSDSRAEDAVLKAGGFSEKANLEYVSKSLNLAQKISDGQKIYVPFEGESAPARAQVAGVDISSKIGINSASSSQLEALPGIGPVSAKKIIDNRPYQDVSDLLNRKVIGKSVFEKIKEKIDLN